VFVYALVLTALGFAVALPYRRWRTDRSASLLPLFTLVLLVGTAQLIDFTDLWLRAYFAVGRSGREEIVRQVQAGELRPDAGSRLIRLPAGYRWLSLDGGEIVVDRDKILFFTFRGVLDHFAGFVYSPDGSMPTDDDFQGDYFLIRQMDVSWYYVSSK
jgi:hypothetical protein